MSRILQEEEYLNGIRNGKKRILLSGLTLKFEGEYFNCER